MALAALAALQTPEFSESSASSGDVEMEDTECYARVLNRGKHRFRPVLNFHKRKIVVLIVVGRHPRRCQADGVQPSWWPVVVSGLLLFSWIPGRPTWRLDVARLRSRAPASQGSWIHGCAPRPQLRDIQLTTIDRQPSAAMTAAMKRLDVCNADAVR